MARPGARRYDDSEQCWRLAQAWYGEVLSPAWRRKTVEEAHAVFAAIGLTGPFWDLRGGA